MQEFLFFRSTARRRWLAFSISLVTWCGCVINGASDVNRLHELLGKTKTLETTAPQAFEDAVKKFIAETGGDAKIQAYYVYGNFLKDQQRYEEAVAAYDKCETDRFLLRDFARFYRAQSNLRAGNHLKAEEFYRSLLTDFPTFPLKNRATYGLGESLNGQKKYAESLTLFQSLLESSDYARDARFQVGKSYFYLNKPQEALDALQQVVEQKTNDSLAPRALELIQQLTAKYPDKKITRSQKFVHAQVLYGSGQRDQARTLWASVAKDQQDELASRARMEIGLAYLKEREYANAAKTFDNIILSGHENYRTQAAYQKILTLRRSGKRSQALDQSARFVKTYPKAANLDQVLMEYGWMLRDNGDYAAALSLYERLVKQYLISPHMDEAYWLAGWCQFKLGKYEQAIATFREFTATKPTSDRFGLAFFWMGKSHERLGQWTDAAAAYRGVIENNTWYYVNRAYDRLETLTKEGRIDRSFIPTMNRMIASSAIPLTTLRENPFPRAKLALALLDYDAAAGELNSVIASSQASRAVAYFHLVDVYRQAENPFQAWVMAHRFSNLPEVRGLGTAPPEEIGQLIYPMVYQETIERAGQEFKMDPYFVAAMIREESRFNPTAVSSSGAYGLMQVMPPTGAEIAQRLGILPFSKERLFEPEVNIRLGTHYMRKVMDRFGGDMTIVSGAYNGGDNRMARWLSEYAIEDRDEFVEQIPLDETRNHIKKVMHAYHVYRYLYGGNMAKVGETGGQG